MPVRSPVRFFFAVALWMVVPMLGCSSDTTPTGPEEGAIEAYLNENPEAAARIDVEEDVEPDE